MSWEVGDLALCVDCGLHPLPDGSVGCAGWKLTEGRVYTVLAVTALSEEGDNFSAPYLWLDGVPGSASHRRFRKVLPDKHEACEEEFVTLLRKSKRKVSA